MKIIALAAGLLIAAIAPAKADWAYTKWGMSLDQVVAASKGAVKILPKRQQGMPLPDTKAYVAAEGGYTDGTTPLEVKFMVDPSGRLTCVFYAPADAKDNSALTALMVKRYGPSQERSGLAWSSPDTISVMELPGGPNVVSHCKKKN